MSTKRLQKNLTVMFTDISGFTKHTETISRNDLMARLDTHNELLMPIVAHFEGKIVKTIGDAFLITFESPTNAVQCGLFMQHTLRKYNQGKDETQQIHIKVSINSGEVTVTDNDVFGDPVNVAAKIEKATNPDEIYFTEAVFLAMNKSEVPTAFVKAFRPKGAESQEIKLYKVAMDEGDERYQKVIRGTTIDKEKMKTRVLELTNLAEKEFVRYQDTLEALVESQGKSSRGTMIAVIAAALILAAAILVGFAVFSTTENPETKVVEGARAYLSSGKPEDARNLILTHIEKHGSSDALNDALKEVDEYELNAATRLAREQLAGDLPTQALSTLKAAIKDRAPGGEQKALLDRAQAYIDARAAMAKGDSARCRELVQIASGGVGMSEGLQKLHDQADAIDFARAIINDPARLKDQSNSAIEKLGIAFGDSSTTPLILEMLGTALCSRVYWEARSKSHDDAKTLLERYRQRFLTISDWSIIEREMHLGGFHNYASNVSLRRDWWNWHSQKWQNHYALLTSAAETDPDFEFRLGVEIHEINRRLFLILTTEQMHIRNALERKPELFEANRARLLELVKRWLEFEQRDDSLARSLVRKHYFDELRPWLVENLTATASYGGDPRPAFSWRQNCFALLADRAELGAIKDPFGYFRDNFEIFMENNWAKADNEKTPLTRAQVRRLFELSMTLEDYRECKRLLDATLEDINKKTGRWGSYNYARDTALAMLEDLKAAQPAHAAEAG